METPNQVTHLLAEIRTGTKDAESRLMDVVYPELRRIALRCMRSERRGHSLQPTALVNEVYLRLVLQRDRDYKNRSHFFAVAATLMRLILVDHARRKRAQKRAGERIRVELTDFVAVSEEHLDILLEIDAALHRLAQWDPRQCKIVELRFFAGLTEDEVAEVLGVAPRTVKRDWKVAKAWLRGELERSPSQEANLNSHPGRC
jgi:RNA polymerase sigma-70 factor (ECF subfamily)